MFWAFQICFVFTREILISSVCWHSPRFTAAKQCFPYIQWLWFKKGKWLLSLQRNWPFAREFSHVLVTMENLGNATAAKCFTYQCRQTKVLFSHLQPFTLTTVGSIQTMRWKLLTLECPLGRCTQDAHTFGQNFPKYNFPLFIVFPFTGSDTIVT